MSRSDVINNTCQLCGREEYREMIAGVRLGPKCLERIEAIAIDAGAPACFPFASYLEQSEPKPRRAVG